MAKDETGRDVTGRLITDPAYMSRLVRHGFGLSDEEVKEFAAKWREKKKGGKGGHVQLPEETDSTQS